MIPLHYMRPWLLCASKPRRLHIRRMQRRERGINTAEDNGPGNLWVGLAKEDMVRSGERKQTCKRDICDHGSKQ